MWDFNSFMHVFSYDTRNIWVFCPAHWPSKTFLELVKSSYWFDIRQWKSLSVRWKFVIQQSVYFFITLKTIYIYTTSEKPVNDQSYGVLDRYGITILYK
jgi:hypothetical protein